MRESLSLVDLSQVMGGQSGGGGEEQEPSATDVGTRTTSFKLKIPLVVSMAYENSHSEPDRYLR